MNGLSVLVIDDDYFDCETIKRGLKGETVSVANDLKTGMEYLNKYKFDLILLDVNLPDANGLAALPYVKQICCKAKIIMISENVYSGLDEIVKAYGGVTIAPKGVLGKEYLQKLTNEILESKAVFS